METVLVSAYLPPPRPAPLAAHPVADLLAKLPVIVCAAEVIAAKARASPLVDPAVLDPNPIA